jgi:hypothetical protein
MSTIAVLPLLKVIQVVNLQPMFGPQTSSQVKMQFCAPIATTEYEKQKINQDEQLENLLDQIASDENSSEGDRRKKLKQVGCAHYCKGL